MESRMESEMGTVTQLALATAYAAAGNRTEMESEIESEMRSVTQLALATA